MKEPAENWRFSGWFFAENCGYIATWFFE